VGFQIVGEQRQEALSAGGGGTAVINAVERLSQVVEEETQLLRQLGSADFERLNHQKNFSLLELTRAMRVLPAHERTPILAARLGRLRDLLDENQRVLKLHLTAAEEIANLVATSIQDAASDGTYSARISRDARR
jgi:flagellar biosynthesis/type III secretory pathway chaperone